MTKTPSSRRTYPWRLGMLAALAAVALLGAACSGVLAGESGGREAGPGASEPAEPGHTPPPSDGGAIGGEDDGDTPVSNEDGAPGRPSGGFGNVPHEEPDYPTKPALAPIDELNVLVLESYPPQYTVQIVSGLPSGCAQYSHTDVERDGTTITVTVWNNVPADDGAICTMIYGMHQSAVNLGSDFESGTEYTVKVNDQEITFTAQ